MSEAKVDIEARTAQLLAESDARFREACKPPEPRSCGLLRRAAGPPLHLQSGLCVRARFSVLSGSSSRQSGRGWLGVWQHWGVVARGCNCTNGACTGQCADQVRIIHFGVNGISIVPLYDHIAGHGFTSPGNTVKTVDLAFYNEYYLPGKVVVWRAMLAYHVQLTGLQLRYNVKALNCETFALWCACGRPVSSVQAQIFVEGCHMFQWVCFGPIIGSLSKVLCLKISNPEDDDVFVGPYVCQLKSWSPQGQQFERWYPHHYCLRPAKPAFRGGVFNIDRYVHRYHG